MAKSVWLGSKIRRLRREHDLAQVELARRLGISASYLNMIERNQRPLTLRLLDRSAEVFGIGADALAQDEDARVLIELMEMFGDPLFRESGVSRDDVQEIVNVAPTAGRALVDLYRVFRTTRQDVESLRERMTDDNFLSTSAYELRTVLTPIRSFAEILHDHKDISRDDQHQFAGILVRESERLAEIIDRMLSLSSGESEADVEGARPAEEQVTDFLQQQLNHFPALEDAAEGIRRSAGLNATNVEPALLARLLDEFHVTVEVVPSIADAASLTMFDAEHQRLIVAESLPLASRRFQLAKWIGRVHYHRVIDDCIPDGALAGDDARDLCRQVLANYLAGAIILPYDGFLSAALSCRYDIDMLRNRFQASVEQICHRLITLQRPGATGLPLHFIRADIAGNISKRFSLSGLRIPRYGGVCPRLNLHSAFMAPGRLSRQVARMPDGSTFFTVARVVAKPTGGLSPAKRYFALALGCDVGMAQGLAYSDGIDLGTSAAVVPVGVTCRLCERMDCGQRAHPPILRGSVGNSAARHDSAGKAGVDSSISA